MRKICAVIGSMASYSGLKSAMSAVQKHPDLDLSIIASASALPDRYGPVVNWIEQDGFRVTGRAHMLVEGETPSTMAKSMGLGLIELATLFEQLQPDLVITVGDGFEAIVTALTASYMSIPVAHTMGGEVSGTIDDSLRHAVTKFAHIHFPASQNARERIIKMGERPEDVYLVGCPRIDLAAEVLERDRNGLGPDLAASVGSLFDPRQPFLIVSQHGVTAEYGAGEQQIYETLLAVEQLRLPTLVMWPNAGTGAEDISRGIRQFRRHHPTAPVHFLRSLPAEVYITLMRRTVCMIGNSSSAIREGAFIGTPAVNVGTRQAHRERAHNVLDVDYDREEIADAVQTQIAHGRYESNSIYGDGHAGERIAGVLSSCSWRLEKQITY